MLQHYSKLSFARLFAIDCKKTCCWNCHKTVQHKDCEFFCQNCKKLLPINVDNYFTLFNLPKSYDIDQAQLSKIYKGYQRQIHPDRFYQASQDEISNADKVSCCVNEGYKTLSDPVKRGEYLLQLFKKEAKIDIPQSYLMQVLDLHEQIDNAADPADLVKIMSEVQKKIHSEKDQLSASLKIADNQIADPTSAALALSKMKYLIRIREAIREKLPVDF